MNSVIASYGCNSLDNDIRYESSSGGVFSILAKSFINDGGVVYGTAMSEDCKEAIYKRVNELVDLSCLRGSKYLQSKIGETYRQVRDDLESGTHVMFSGCPCQVNGLKLFLGKEYDNLFCLDIICHGVPSPKLWKLYTEHFEKKNHAVIKKVNFRSKNQGVREQVSFGDMSNIYSSKKDNPYIQMFLRNYSLRPSCYECRSKTYRSADITIGDFWGIENVLPDLNDSKGTSLVLVRTQKGEEKFEAIKRHVIHETCDYKQAIMKNSAEYKSTARPEQRAVFFTDMNALTFDALEKKYIGSSMMRNAKKLIKEIIGKDKGQTSSANSDYGLLICYVNK